MSATIAVEYDCPACGGDGWLPSLPEGESACTAEGCKDGKVTEHKPARRARVHVSRATAGALSAYMPRNYKVARRDGDHWVIEGYDYAGWTLDGYVIPRLASGMIFAEEVPA